VFDTQLAQLFHIAEQLAIDVVFDFRHAGVTGLGLLALVRQRRQRA
jgi:hypothetical protein